MRRFFIILLAFSALWGCVYPFDADLPEGASPSLVIEGNICIGEDSRIMLSYVEPLKNGGVTKSVPLSEVYVEDHMGSRFSSEFDGKGYVVNTSKARTNRRFRVVVICEGKKYVSEYQGPMVAPRITDAKITADKDNVYVKVSFQAASAGVEYAAVRFQEAWEFHVDYVKMYYYDELAGAVQKLDAVDLSRYYCWRTEEHNDDILVDMSSTGGKVKDLVVQSFPRNDNRNHRQYWIKTSIRLLSSDEYRYRVQLRDNATQGGDLFSPDPGEIPSNITCESDPETRVYGYVNVCRSASTLDFVDNKYFITGPVYSLAVPEPEEYADYYARGLDAVADYVSIDASGIGWGYDRCYDCVAAGGTLEQPDFVP